MFYPQVNDNNNSQLNIDNFYGYNHTFRPSLGEFYDMTNLTSDGFPVMSVRPIRQKVVRANKEIRGMIYTGGHLAWIDGYTFHYSNIWSISLFPLERGLAHKVTSLDEPHDESIPAIWEEEQLIEMGGYVLIYPANIWVNMNTREAGMMGAKYRMEAETDVTYSISDAEGEAYENVTASPTAPANPTTGKYWLCTQEEAKGLNVYIGDSWQPVATTYIRIDMPGANLDELFSEGDIVYMNSAYVPDINDGSQIQKVASDYIVVIGLLNTAQPIVEHNFEEWRFTVERKIPKYDYYCVAGNRVWACRYGFNLDDVADYNEIACTKLGDFKNWTSYQGLSTDSYAVTIGTPGAWTGAITFQGRPTFFKENTVIRIYGSTPSEYTVNEKECRGVQQGSDKSLAIVGENVYYKAPGGIMVYDGSMPTMISTDFGRDDIFFDAVGCANNSKYYLQCVDTHGKHMMFVYDLQYGFFTKETSIDAFSFSSAMDGRAYGCTKKNIYTIGLNDSELMVERDTYNKTAPIEDRIINDEEYVTWSAETGDIDGMAVGFKYLGRISMRCYIPLRSELVAEISYDDRPFEKVGTLRGNDEKTSKTLTIFPYRCDHFRLRFSGHGDVRIYQIAMTVDAESEEHGNTYR